MYLSPKREAELREQDEDVEVTDSADDFMDQVLRFGESVMVDGELPEGWETLDLGTENVDGLNRFGEQA